MFEWYKARRLRKLVEVRQAEIALKLLDSDRFKKSLEDEDEGDWKLLGKDTEKGLDIQDQTDMRDQAIKYYYRNPWGRNIIRLFEKYVVGRGFQITPESSEPSLVRYWKEFWRINKMENRKKEIVRRSMRDGECFIRYFKKIGMLILRFMAPAKVEEPDTTEKTIGNASFGIETDKDDVEEVLAYWYAGKRLNADEVHHNKILVDSDVKRGRSFLEVAMPFLAMYKRWLNDRMKLNMVRSIVALVKKVKGTPAQAAIVADKYETTSKKAPDGTAYHRAPDGVSVFTTNQGVDYQMLSPNLQAADVEHDGRAVLLAIAAGAGLPEFMITSNAENSNYASTMIAEGPGVMEFEDWQDYFASVFKDIFAKAIETGMAAGKISKYEIIRKLMPVEQEDGSIEYEEQDVRQEVSTDCKIIFPELITRDIKEETEALILQNNQGWASGHTASARLDLNYDEEQELFRQEEEPETGGEEEEKDEYGELRREEGGEEGIKKEEEPETE